MSPNAADPSSAGSRFDEFFVASIVILVCALPFLLGDQPSSLMSAAQMGVTSPEGDAAKQVILAFAYAAGGALLIARTRAPEWKLLGAPLALLLLLCLASAAWSELPSLPLRRSLALAGTFTLGLYAGLRLTEPQLVRALLWCTVIVLLASLAVVVLAPGSGFDPEGRLRGVFAHKNGLGSFAAMGLLVVFVHLRHAVSRWAQAGLLALGLLCAAALVLAESATPIAALLFAALAGLVGRYVGRTAVAVLLYLALAFGLLLPLLAHDLGELASAFGRNQEFSGRTRVWLFGVDYLTDAPALGYGYGAFWTGPTALSFERWAGFPVPHAHNGYLDLALGVGALGLALAIYALLRLIRTSTHALNPAESTSAGFNLGFLAMFLISNLTETNLAVGNDIMTMLFVFLVVRGNGLRLSQTADADKPTEARQATLRRTGVHR